MSNLSAFLHPVLAEDQEIIISDRFRDEKGKPVPFKIKALTQEEVDAITKSCTTVRRDKAGRESRSFDSARFTKALVVAGTIEPDFRAKEICDAYGVVDPLLVPGKMLLAGEFAKLGDEIAKLSGIDDEPEEEAKN